jgi:predicted esterase
MPKIKIPILFVKGARDALIPKTQMDRLQKIYSDLKG